jgi:hypothetical protein
MDRTHEIILFFVNWVIHAYRTQHGGKKCAYSVLEKGELPAQSLKRCRRALPEETVQNCPPSLCVYAKRRIMSRGLDFERTR